MPIELLNLASPVIDHQTNCPNNTTYTYNTYEIFRRIDYYRTFQYYDYFNHSIMRDDAQKLTVVLETLHKKNSTKDSIVVRLVSFLFVRSVSKVKISNWRLCRTQNEEMRDRRWRTRVPMIADSSSFEIITEMIYGGIR